MVATPTPSPYSLRALLSVAVLLFIGIGLQSSLAFSLSFFGAQPDFLLTLALCTALVTEAEFGAVVGFLSGLGMAALAGTTVGTYLVSHTAAAWLVGGLRYRFVRAGFLITILGVAVGTIVSGVLFGLSVPRIGLLRWLTITFVSAVWNAVVALPLTVILRWVFPQK